MEIIQTILVEDSLSMQSFIRTAIESNFKNIQVNMVKNGALAMREMQTNPYHLVLCDWNTPVLSGDKLLQWIRETPSLKEIPFIMITGNSKEADVLKAKELGANDYIVKPFTLDVLITKLHKNCTHLMRTE